MPSVSGRARRLLSRTPPQAATSCHSRPGAEAAVFLCVLFACSSALHPLSLQGGAREQREAAARPGARPAWPWQGPWQCAVGWAAALQGAPRITRQISQGASRCSGEEGRGAPAMDRHCTLLQPHLLTGRNTLLRETSPIHYYYDRQVQLFME